MLSWLIDEDGDTMPDSIAVLDAHLSQAHNRDAVARFLQANSGHIRVVVTGAVAKVIFEREVVHPYAVVGLLRLLVELQPSAVAIQESEATTRTNVIRERSAWLDYFGSLAHSLKGSDSRVSRTIALASSPFASRYKAAGTVVSKVDDPTTRFEILDELTQGMFVLMKQSAGTGILAVETMGTWYANGLKTDFTAEPKGRRLSEAPSGGYGRWVQAHYENVLRLGEPVADDVDATVSWEGNKPLIHRYTRLVLPVQRGSSDSWLLAMLKLRTF